MDEQLRERCDLLAENRKLIRDGFKWESDIMYAAASFAYAGIGRKADVERMKECRAVLKRSEGIFSDFRGHMMLVVLSKMAMAEDPEAWLKEQLAIHGKLHKNRVFGSEYMALAACSICNARRADQADEIVEKTKTLMKKMKQAHPVLTSDSDMAYAALLALTDKSVDRIMGEMEEAYTILKDKFRFHKDAVQALSQVLTLCEGDDVTNKCARTAALYDAMRQQNIRFGKEKELASLGLLIHSRIDDQRLISEIGEAEQYLRKCRGFGSLAMSKQTRLMFGALLAADLYSPDGKASDETATVGTSVAIAIAQEIALLVAIAASSAAASSSSASRS